jgi:tripartite-type tricarboxylate transporter receptor subunit TctC
VLALPLALAPFAAHAAYPERAIRLVLPFGPGSASDTFLRLVAEPLQVALGQSVIIDNKPGALTSLALADVAKAAPDGYTVVAATNSIVANPAGVQRSVPYDPLRDFTPITRLGTTSYVLVVAADKPWKTIAELVEYARANPGKLNYASGNLGGLLYGGMLARSIGVDMTHVPYKSTPQGLVDLLGGQVQLMFTDLVTALGQAKAGKVRVLLATAPQRTALFPDVPTIAEAGLRNIADMPAWWSLYGPAGMPKETVERLNREVVAVLHKPELRARLLTLGLEATPSTPQELATFTREQLQSYQRLIKEFGIQPE